VRVFIVLATPVFLVLALIFAVIAFGVCVLLELFGGVCKALAGFLTLLSDACCLIADLYKGNE
jgi:hypothetical protein